ncbi:MAG: peptide chain release factor N(5)-glutamine methyltransferase [Nitrospira sp.]|nr:peptide chain release factor N(5)-glutamine methyltransferase [Nitrospira sp.]
MGTLTDARIVTVGDLLRWGRVQLAQAGIEDAARETAWLLEHALGMTALEVRVKGAQPVEGSALRRTEALLARRASREPLQYLLGTQEFCGLEFSVAPGVLIPRPETELLVDETILRVTAQAHPVIADVGTGSGCIAVPLACRVPQAALYAVDRSADALRIAQRNAARHGVLAQVTFLEGDLLVPLREQGMAGRVDVIVSNPPYIAERDWDMVQPEVRLYEPRLALAAGEDGLAVYRRLVPEAAQMLCAAGWIILEVGRGQAGAVRALIEATGRYGAMKTRTDAAGIERVVIAQKR